MLKKTLLGTSAALLGCVLMTAPAAAQQLPPPPSLTQPSTAEPAKPPPKPKTAKPKTAKPKPKKQQAPLSLTAPPPNVAPPSTAAPGNMPPRPPADVGNAPSPPPAAQTPLLAQPARASHPTLNARQLALVERASQYLSNLRTLVGMFKQIAPDGQQSTGDFYLWKPGRVRFDYNPPNPTEVIADGKAVAVRNRDLASQDTIVISQTPLRFLLSERIDLLKDTDIVAVYGDNVFLTVVIEERNIARGSYRIMLMFDAKTTQLKQWVVTDPQGLDTTIAVYNLDTETKPDPELFKIDYTRNVK